MALTTLSPRIRGFICTTAHPLGCARNIEQQISVARSQQVSAPGGYRVLILGASTGYGLAARIVATWRYGAKSLGIFYERLGEGTKPGTPGYYNTVAFQHLAQREGYTSLNINGDAFFSAVKEQAMTRLKAELGQVDLVIYSLAAPRTGTIYNSTLKPVGRAYTSKTINLNNDAVMEMTLPPATAEEITATVAVMGGDDLRLWTETLLAANALAEGVRLVAFSYIGPEVTWPIYRSGTIGKAKEDLERTVTHLEQLLHTHLGGHAWVSINKGVITQASAAIPFVPLYLSLLYRIMKERGLHEEPIHQMVRLFRDHVGPQQTPSVDAEGRIRLDNYELTPDIQAEITRRWEMVDTGNLSELSDYEGVKRNFRQLFGFEVGGIDYSEAVEVEASLA